MKSLNKNYTSVLVRRKEETKEEPMNKSNPRKYVPKPLYNNPTVVSRKADLAAEEKEIVELELIWENAMKEKFELDALLKTETMTAAIAFHDEMIDRHKSGNIGLETLTPGPNPAFASYALSRGIDPAVFLELLE